jgi:hypothetical protein
MVFATGICVSCNVISMWHVCNINIFEKMHQFKGIGHHLKPSILIENSSVYISSLMIACAYTKKQFIQPKRRGFKKSLARDRLRSLAAAVSAVVALHCWSPVASA